MKVLCKAIFALVFPALALATKSADDSGTPNCVLALSHKVANESGIFFPQGQRMWRKVDREGRMTNVWLKQKDGKGDFFLYDDQKNEYSTYHFEKKWYVEKEGCFELTRNIGVRKWEKDFKKADGKYVWPRIYLMKVDDGNNHPPPFNGKFSDHPDGKLIRNDMWDVMACFEATKAEGNTAFTYFYGDGSGDDECYILDDVPANKTITDASVSRAHHYRSFDFGTILPRPGATYERILVARSVKDFRECIKRAEFEFSRFEYVSMDEENGCFVSTQVDDLYPADSKVAARWRVVQYPYNAYPDLPDHMKDCDCSEKQQYQGQPEYQPRPPAFQGQEPEFRA